MTVACLEKEARTNRFHVADHPISTHEDASKNATNPLSMTERLKSTMREFQGADLLQYVEVRLGLSRFGDGHGSLGAGSHRNSQPRMYLSCCFSQRCRAHHSGTTSFRAISMPSTCKGSLVHKISGKSALGIGDGRMPRSSNRHRCHIFYLLRRLLVQLPYLRWFADKKQLSNQSCRKEKALRHDWTARIRHFCHSKDCGLGHAILLRLGIGSRSKTLLSYFTVLCRRSCFHSRPPCALS